MPGRTTDVGLLVRNRYGSAVLTFQETSQRRELALDVAPHHHLPDLGPGKRHFPMDFIGLRQAGARRRPELADT